MLEFLFGKKVKNPPKDVRLNEVYKKLQKHFEVENIPDERKAFLRKTM